MAELAKANGMRVVFCSLLPACAFPLRPGLQPPGKRGRLNRMHNDDADKNKIV